MDGRQGRAGHRGLATNEQTGRVRSFKRHTSQETKWKEAIRYYDPIVQKQSGGGAEPQLLNVPAAVLANLCVAYIMTSQNEAAEELMRKIEKEVGEHCRLLLF